MTLLSLAIYLLAIILSPFAYWLYLTVFGEED